MRAKAYCSINPRFISPPDSIVKNPPTEATITRTQIKTILPPGLVNSTPEKKVNTAITIDTIKKKNINLGFMEQYAFALITTMYFVGFMINKYRQTMN